MPDLVPDRSLTPYRLEAELLAFRREAETAEAWRLREAYVDRGTSDPYYLIWFEAAEREAGDDLLDDWLFDTHVPGLRMKRSTRDARGARYDYWRALGRAALLERLERFAQMYRDDSLQPPGEIGEPGRGRPHERFADRRFLYQIRSPRRVIVGVGPRSWAAGPPQGALHGVVLDDLQRPAAGQVVELRADRFAAERTTDAQGRFWFSRLPTGTLQANVRGRSCQARVQRVDPFGVVRGEITDSRATPLDGVEVELEAPDREIFGALSGAGRFDVGPVPGFSYVVRLIGYRVIHHVTLQPGTVLEGTLRAVDGQALGGVVLELTRTDTAPSPRPAVFRQTTDWRGGFRFTGIEGGTFALTAQGFELSSPLPSGAPNKPVRLDLRARPRP